MQIYDTNNSGKVKIIEAVDSNRFLIEFIDTGFRKEVNRSNLKSGNIKDPSLSFKSEPLFINEIWSSNNSGDFEIIWRNGEEALIQFISTGHSRIVNYVCAKNGKVKDPYSPSVYNVGFEGEFERVYYWKQAKQLWRNMMKRCYCAKDSKGYYGKGVTVSDDWKCFANFLKDLPDIQNFDLWLKGFNEGETKYNLDKDLIKSGNKVYTKHLCCFVTEHVNKSAGGSWSPKQS